MDSKLEHDTGTLVIKGFWLEDHATVDDAFVQALVAGLRGFMGFVGAGKIDLEAMAGIRLYEKIKAVFE